MSESDNPRKIPASSIAVAALIIALSMLAGFAAVHELALQGYSVILQFFFAVVCFYAVAVAGYRTFLRFFPLKEGPVVAGPTAFAYCTYMLLNLFIFYPVQQSSFFLPWPFKRFFYQLLGARLGRNTHCPCVISDPPLVEIGHNVALGGECKLSCHSAEGDLYFLARIRIGDRATIGSRALIMPGVTIGEGAIVGAGAVVTKGTQILAKEVWGGVPARRIKARDGSRHRAESESAQPRT